MPGRFVTKIISRLPGLRRLPVFKLLAIAEIALLAKKHYGKLTPQERHRLVELVRTGRGRSANLAPAEQKELAALVAKVEPRLFAGLAADKLSPIPLPRRLVEGRRSAPGRAVHAGSGVGGPALQDPAR
jgi:hypothetical protein